MARWDEIFSLPVQNPPSSEFSSDEMVWSKVEGWRDNIDRVALIPFARVADFVRGESNRKDCPTRFHVEARRRRRSTTPYKPKVDGVLEYILYWCSFGPDDHRKGGVVRPSRNTYVPKKKKNAGRPNTKRGCTCHFIVKRLIAEPSVALVIYNEEKHVDKKGAPCHGPQDKKAAGTRAVFAPYISEELRLRVLSLLHVGISVETIMQRHNESVERQGGPCNRDDLLTHRYVRRQERSIRRSTHELDNDDSVSVGLWVETHRNNVFFYEDFSDSEPFTLGIQTEWQFQQMIQFGNRSLLVSDSRFGTNKLKYPVYSILVFNSEKKAIPVAWIISPRFSSSDTYKWMRALYNRILTKDPSWRLAGFIIDDPLADVHAIRDVFQCSVLVSFWRLRHAWQKHLMQKCVGNEIRVEISRRLGKIVDGICKGEEAMGLFEDFMKDFEDEAEFLDYLTATWCPRLGDWIAALKSLPLASQETCAAVELYHNQLKLRLLNEKNPKLYQRTDWLVDKLNNKVHSHFWLDEYPDKDDFARYKNEEWASGLTSWRKALEIPDSDIAVDAKNAKVKDQLDGDREYAVCNAGSHFGVCDCKWAEMGNLCEHILKAISMLRKKIPDAQSISLLQYHKALINLLNCPPRDSLICDHAVALAVLVQKQMNALVSGDQLISPDEVQQLVNERNEDTVTGNENDDQNDPGSSRNGSRDESTNMEVDPPGLHSVVEAVSGGEEAVGNSENDHLPSNSAAIDTIECTVDPLANKGTKESEMDVDSVNLDTLQSTAVTHQTDDSQPKSVSNDTAIETVVNKGTQESEMDVESVNLDTSQSTMEFSVTHKTNDAHAAQPKSISASMDVDKLSLDKTSSPMAVPVESHEVEIS